MTPRDQAASAIDDYGRAEYVRGFLLGISAAWKAWRWIAGAKPKPTQVDWAKWVRGAIAEAYREAGVEMPEEGKEP
jgi:hypothetical protein